MLDTTDNKNYLIDNEEFSIETIENNPFCVRHDKKENVFHTMLGQYNCDMFETREEALEDIKTISYKNIMYLMAVEKQVNNNEKTSK